MEFLAWVRLNDAAEDEIFLQIIGVYDLDLVRGEHDYNLLVILGHKNSPDLCRKSREKISLTRVLVPEDKHTFGTSRIEYGVGVVERKGGDWVGVPVLDNLSLLGLILSLEEIVEKGNFSRFVSHCKSGLLRIQIQCCNSLLLRMNFTHLSVFVRL